LLGISEGLTDSVMLSCGRTERMCLGRSFCPPPSLHREGFSFRRLGRASLESNGPSLRLPRRDESEQRRPWPVACQTIVEIQARELTQPGAPWSDQRAAKGGFRAGDSTPKCLPSLNPKRGNLLCHKWHLCPVSKDEKFARKFRKLEFLGLPRFSGEGSADPGCMLRCASRSHSSYYYA
jgi:hypothetical protein